MEVSFCLSSSAQISAIVNPRRNTTPSIKYRSKILIKPTTYRSRYVPLKCCHGLPSSSRPQDRRENCLKAAGGLGGSSGGTEHEVAKAEPIVKRVADFLDTLWIFLRPYALRGTIIASMAIAARTWIENANLLTWSLPLKSFFGLITLICAHGFIVGINQIYDVEIDRVNKPYLPIAAGHFSLQFAWKLIALFVVTGVGIIWMLKSDPFIFPLYFMSLFLGAIYSVPPIRTKRSSAAAFLTIGGFRGFLIYSIHYATRASLGLPFQWSLPVAFITIFAVVFALAISITKDLPDVEGDQKFKISTFATNVGVRNVALVGSGLLLLNYVGGILAAIYMPQAFNRNFILPAHIGLSLCLIFQAWLLEQKNYTKEASTRFYLFLWNLYCAEFMIFPFI